MTVWKSASCIRRNGCRCNWTDVTWRNPWEPESGRARPPKRNTTEWDGGCSAADELRSCDHPAPNSVAVMIAQTGLGLSGEILQRPARLL